MPFQITTQPFGTLADATTPLTEYILEHTETGEFISVIPGFGAVLRRLVLRKGQHLFALLQGPASVQALAADESYAGALLYPFPSRIRHGIYTFEGTAYTLPMNEARSDSALHGFVHGKPFSVVNQVVTDTHAQLVLRYEYTGNESGYPFPFALTVSYTLVQASLLMAGNAMDRMCALRVDYAAENTGLSLAPAAFGWHPYFMLAADSTTSGESIDDMTLTLPDRSPIGLDENMLPNGIVSFENAGTIPLAKQEMDSVFRVESADAAAPNPDFVETVLTSGTTGVKLIVGQQTGPGKLNYIVCYTPPQRDCIAIEPWTANVNAFNNGEGLSILNPGDTLSGKITVRLD